MFVEQPLASPGLLIIRLHIGRTNKNSHLEKYSNRIFLCHRDLQKISTQLSHIDPLGLDCGFEMLVRSDYSMQFVNTVNVIVKNCKVFCTFNILQ